MIEPDPLEDCHVYINALDNEDNPYRMIVRLKGDTFEIWHDDVLLAQGERQELRFWTVYPIVPVVAGDVTLSLRRGMVWEWGTEHGRHSISTPDIKDWPLGLDEIGHLHHVV